MPHSVHSRADEIHNFNFKWWNTLRKTWELFFQNHVNILGTQSIIRDRQKLEAKVFFVTPKTQMQLKVNHDEEMLQSVNLGTFIDADLNL